MPVLKPHMSSTFLATLAPHSLLPPSHPASTPPPSPQDEPRASSVPSRERPGGHYATPKGRTPLQQHLDYFDM
jgi:hypothetical protein